jgi:hypothetical protein
MTMRNQVLKRVKTNCLKEKITKLHQLSLTLGKKNYESFMYYIKSIELLRTEGVIYIF